MQRFFEFTHRFAVNHAVVVTVLAILAMPRFAAGADDSKRHTAFRQGVDAIQAEKWDEALAIYRKLWDEEHTYDVALSLGQVELNLKTYRDAAEHLEFGLRNIPPREEAAVTTRARHMLDVARAEVGAVKIIVDRTNAEVSIDGKIVGASPLPADVFLDPGPHTIGAKSPGSTPIEQAIQATAGRTTTLKLAFGEKSGSAGAPVSSAPGAPETPPGTPAVSATQSAGTSDENGSGSTARTAVLIGGIGVTALAAAVTVVFALQGASAANDADDARTRATARFGQDPCSGAAGSASAECGALADALDRRASHNRAANVALFFTAVAGVSTAATFLFWPKGDKQPERALRLVPQVGRNAGGALLTGSF